MIISDDSTVFDDDVFAGLSTSWTIRFYFFDNVHSLSHLSKNDVLSIKPVGDNSGDEELRAICVGSGIGHWEKSRAVVFLREVLIFELFPVDWSASGAVEVGEISSLEHELRDHSVEKWTLVAISLLTCAEHLEVFSGFGDDIIVKLKDDLAERGCLLRISCRSFCHNCEVEEADGIGHVEIIIDRILFKFDLNQYSNIQEYKSVSTFINIIIYLPWVIIKNLMHLSCIFCYRRINY